VVVIARALAGASLLSLLLASTGCVRSSPLLGAPLAASSLPGTDGVDHAITPGGTDRLTVLVFFADHCPCQAAHDVRLRELYAAYHPRGVDLFAVDSETGATPERDAAEATKRSYPFPILFDHGGALAKRLRAEYATETFVLDARGVVRYHGGIDADKTSLHPDATPFLRDALDDLLAARTVRRAESKALGCSLQTW
jgi:peroxiredoxin